MLSTTYQPPLRFSSLVLAEPMLLRAYRADETPLDLAAGSARRRDVWSSRADALRTLQARPTFGAWDPLILQIYVVSALATTVGLR